MKTTTLRDMLKRNPEEVLFKAIKGMVPKNRLRDDLIKKKLFIYSGPFHPHHNKGLPQFTEQEPHDINEILDLGTKLVENRHQYKVIFESDPANPAEEFADVERDIDESIGYPIVFEKKTHTNPKSNLKTAQALRGSYKQLARYRKH